MAMATTKRKASEGSLDYPSSTDRAASPQHEGRRSQAVSSYQLPVKKLTSSKPDLTIFLGTKEQAFPPVTRRSWRATVATLTLSESHVGEQIVGDPLPYTRIRSLAEDNCIALKRVHSSPRNDGSGSDAVRSQYRRVQLRRVSSAVTFLPITLRKNNQRST